MTLLTIPNWNSFLLWFSWYKLFHNFLLFLWQSSFLFIHSLTFALPLNISFIQSFILRFIFLSFIDSSWRMIAKLAFSCYLTAKDIQSHSVLSIHIAKAYSTSSQEHVLTELMTSFIPHNKIVLDLFISFYI